jgi:pyroglutamyl-peptidase
MIYEDVLNIVPGLHLRPPQLPEDVPDGTEPPPEGYDFIFHVGAAGRGSLRMEIIGHKYGYNMKDASGAFCAVVPPISAAKNLNNTRGPGAGPPGAMTLAGQYSGPGSIHAGGFGSMGMGYNNERLGYNPAVHDPQPGIPGSETSIRPMRGFGTAYETFPDEMATDLDVTRLVQDLKASGATVRVISAPFPPLRTNEAAQHITGNLYVDGRRPLSLRFHLLLFSRRKQTKY